VSKPGRYSKVYRRMWVDEKVKKLTQPPPCGFTLWQRLLTGPELTNIPGLFPAWEGGLASALHWSLEAFRDAFREVNGLGMVEADWDAGLVWVPNAIEHNEPESIHVVESWGSTIRELPDCALKSKAFAMLGAWAKAKGMAWEKAWEKASGMASPMRGNPPSPIQEQEQYTRSDLMGGSKDLTGSARTEPETPAPPAKISTGAKRFAQTFETEAPDQIEFTPEHRAFEANGIDLQQTWLECRDHRRSKKFRCEDWPAEFTAWLRREAKYRREGGKRPTPKPPQPNDPTNRYVPDRVIT
jgi:hypothetical protein